jgi:hypothetical protein
MAGLLALFSQHLERTEGFVRGVEVSTVATIGDFDLDAACRLPFWKGVMMVRCAQSQAPSPGEPFF